MATLTTEERALYTQRLRDAENALHLLVTGQQARVYVDQNGERVEYVSARTNDLRKYIDELKGILNPGTPRRPLRVWPL